MFDYRKVKLVLNFLHITFFNTKKIKLIHNCIYFYNIIEDKSSEIIVYDGVLIIHQSSQIV